MREQRHSPNRAEGRTTPPTKQPPGLELGLQVSSYGVEFLGSGTDVLLSVKSVLFLLVNLKMEIWKLWCNSCH